MHGCDKSSSCSSTCSPKSCKPHKEKCEPAEVICCKYGDARVSIESQFLLVGTGLAPDANVSGAPLGLNSRADVVLHGNGFLFKTPKNKKSRKGKKVCKPAGCYEDCGESRVFIMTAASVVLLPPSISSAAAVYPETSASINGLIQNELNAATRILVGVQNVNGKGCNVTYEAQLVGVDGTGNMALLEICHSGNNQCLPKIEKCHPRVKIPYCPDPRCGDKVYLLGDVISSVYNREGSNSSGFVEGVVSDPNFVEHSGWMLSQNILVDAQVYGPPGMPILDCRGCLLGMQVTNLAGFIPARDEMFLEQQTGAIGQGLVAGPTTTSIRAFIKKILKGNSCCGDNDELISVQQGSGNSFYRIRKAYLGLAYELPSTGDCGETVNYTSGTYAAGQPRFRVNIRGELSGCRCGPEATNGVRVLGLAGLNPSGLPDIENGLYYVPGGDVPAVIPPNPLPSDLPISPLIGIAQPGDIIKSMSYEKKMRMRVYELGDGECQFAPQRVLEDHCPGDILEITIIKGNGASASGFNGQSNNNCEQCKKVALAEMPAMMDYPWYANNFPRVLYNAIPAGTYPAFLAPINQETEPQVPELNTVGAAIFHPAV